MASCYTDVDEIHRISSKLLEIVQIRVIALTKSQVAIQVEIQSEQKSLICPRILNKEQALHGVQHQCLFWLTSLDNTKKNASNRMKYTE